MISVTQDEKCLTCNHWQGDVARQLDHIAQYGEKCMDRKHGWPISGECKEIFNEIEIDVLGDARARVSTPSNFKCSRYNSGGTKSE